MFNYDDVSVLIQWVYAENDPLFPEEVLEYGKKELGTSKVEHEVKVYSGVPHGKFQEGVCCEVALESDICRFRCPWRVRFSDDQGSTECCISSDT